MTKSDNLKWEISRRLEEIERCLFWNGQVSRIDLISSFGISSQQASTDLKKYMELQPDCLRYSHSQRVYTPTASFNPHLTRPSMSDYMAWSAGHTRAIMDIPVPHREPNAEIVRGLTMARHTEQSIEIAYQSLTWDRTSSRFITPHAIISDGQRYHVRAYCHTREDFRDFVITRIKSTGIFSDPGPGKNDDEDWNTKVILRLKAHPDLPASHITMLEMEYDMQDGELRMPVRLALLRYTLLRLRIDEFTYQRRPEDQQLVLMNPEIMDLLP